jgi:hypothetical protein
MDYKNCIKCRLLNEPPKFHVKSPPLVPDDFINLLKLSKNYNLSLKLEKINYLIKQEKLSTLTPSTLSTPTTTTTDSIISNLFIFTLCAILFIFIFLLFILAYFR